MREIIRLTENDVRQMVKQTAMRILRESEDDYASDPLRDLKRAKAKAQARLKTFNWQMCQKYGTNDWLDKYGYDHENNRPTQDAIRLLGLDAQYRKAEQELEEFNRETLRRRIRRNMNEAIRRATKRAMNEVKVNTPDGEVELHGSWNDAPGIDGRNGRRDATEYEKLNAGKSWAFMRGLRLGREDNFADMDNMSMSLADKDRFNVDREINSIASDRDIKNANDIFDDYAGAKPEEPEYEDIPDEDNPMEKRRKMTRNDRKRQEYRNARSEYSDKAIKADTAGRSSLGQGRLTGKSMFGSMKDKYGASR
jgi:hypothetical protein